MGIQFFHYDAFSREASTAKSKQGHSIYSIAGEADRIEGYHDHVLNPKEPIILHGVSFSKVVEIAEEYAEKTKDSIGRKVKKKDCVMIAGVISAPVDMPVDIWEIYKKECISWLIKKWGVSLRSVVEHIDENFEDEPNKLHQHIHFACIPKTGIRFWKIHPGLTAKRKVDLAYGITSKPDNMSDEEYKKFKKSGRENGDKAYKKEMSKEQDRFYEELGEPFGLLRYGPKRLRYSRKEMIQYNQEKRIKYKNILKREEQKNNADIIIKESKNEANRIVTDAENIKTNATMILQVSKDEAEKIRENAWKKANEITNIAKEQAASIIDKAMKFINDFFKRILKLPGGKAEVDWALNRINSIVPKKKQLIIRKTNPNNSINIL
jgi:hypothetical protein